MMRFDDIIKRSRSNLPKAFKIAFIAAVCVGFVAYVYK